MNSRKIIHLLDDIIHKVTEVELSTILPKVLTVAKQLNDKEFEKWLLLETSGYFDTNPALTNEVVVPFYRNVTGQYKDRYNRPLVIEDPKLHFINTYSLRESVVELEDYSKKTGSISFENPRVNQFIKDEFGIIVHTFLFNPGAVKPILNEIRNKVINWLMEKHKEISSVWYPTNINPDLPIELSGFHPLVQKTAGDLYKNGHYRQSILDTYIMLVNAVKVKSGMFDLDNTPLMQKVFSPKSPKIIVSSDNDEQQGFMWLFSGAVMAIRNPRAHKIIEQNDPQRTLEWLSFASVLVRILDDAGIQEDEEGAGGI